MQANGNPQRIRDLRQQADLQTDYYNGKEIQSENMHSWQDFQKDLDFWILTLTHGMYLQEVGCEVQELKAMMVLTILFPQLIIMIGQRIKLFCLAIAMGLQFIYFSWWYQFVVPVYFSFTRFLILSQSNNQFEYSRLFSNL